MKPSSVAIVGILNVTPNSFYDGGKFLSLAPALDRVQQMIGEGADIIEVGGESTGPNAPEVLWNEELNRAIPLVRAIRERWPTVAVAVDTYKARIAREAIVAGATLINDVSAGRADPEMFTALAEAPAVRYVLMYAKDSTPRTTVQATAYDNVVETVSAFLQERAQAAQAAGIQRGQIIVDPGFGHFVSSEAQYSLQLLRRLVDIAAAGYPLLISPSRKSCLSGHERVGPEHRLPATLAATVFAVQGGAAYVRTHDIVETRRVIEITQAVLSA